MFSFSLSDFWLSFLINEGLIKILIIHPFIKKDLCQKSKLAKVLLNIHMYVNKAGERTHELTTLFRLNRRYSPLEYLTYLHFIKKGSVCQGFTPFLSARIELPLYFVPSNLSLAVLPQRHNHNNIDGIFHSLYTFPKSAGNLYSF